MVKSLNFTVKFIFGAMIFFAFTYAGHGQGICSGNLGDNIFDRGDFGSGTALVLQNDPDIAPGYTYTTNVPADGFYSVCSNTNALNGLYPTWLVVQDNSSDPNGYMMVVNASFEPGIFYEEVVDELCENTLYEFSADIINLIKIGVANHIDPNVSFLIDNQEVYSTGTIPKTENWRQYGFSFVTDANQTSVTLTLRNNAPGGIGNDLALDNISFRPCGPSSFIGVESDTTIFLCIDDEPLNILAAIDGTDGQQFSIQWQESQDGIIWNTVEDSTNSTITHTNFEPGDYYYRYYSAANEVNILNEKCRIISDVINITILPDIYSVSDTLCEGLVYEFGSQQITTPGQYEESFESQYGCDSTVFLYMVFVPPQPINIEVELTDPSCFGFEDGTLVVDVLDGGNGDLSFTLTDEENTPISSTTGAGIYDVEVLDRYGCIENFEYELFNPPVINVSIGMDTTVKLGDEILFTPEYSANFETIFWQGQGEFSCDNCENPVYVPFFDGDVEVFVTDQSGCVASDNITVDVDDESFLLIPNIFSPNDDNVNDFLTINYYGRSVSELLQFDVYDRWGGLVHSFNNVKPITGGIIWDGYKGSRKVETGLYFYKIHVQLINGVLLDRIGNVTLVK